MLKRLTVLLVAFGLFMIGFTAGTYVYTTAAAPQTTTLDLVGETNIEAVNPQLEALTDLERIRAEVYNRVSPSVVAINITTQVAGGNGSGFVIDKAGNIVTNYHVIEGAETIAVNFLDGTIARAEVVGVDPDSDLAVIKVELPEDRLIPVTFGSSDDLVVGQSVLAIGSPFGERWTLTNGIVSALERSIRGLNTYSIGSVIQTDAAINPGNSGGPLLNLQGQVVGVNAQIRTGTGANSGVGFAIPSLLVERVARELIEMGRVDYSLIGIVGGDIDLFAMEALNLENSQRGIVVSEATPNLPAANAGVRSAKFSRQGTRLDSADVIIAIDDKPLGSMAEFIAYLARETRPGDVVNLSVIREGEVIKIPVELGSRRQALATE